MNRITRGASGVEVDFTTPSGRTIVKAKKLIMSVPPLLSVLEPWFDITANEKALFGQFNNSYIWDAIVNNTGFPSNTAIQNRDPGAADGIPASPGSYAFVPSPFGVHATWYGSDDYLTDDQVKANILHSISQVRTANNYTSTETPEIVEFHSHNPYELTVCVDAIRNGFYNKVNALQGESNTYWTGAAWESHDSTAIWNFTETEILPKILSSLN